jgi:hypothetical protein
MKTFRQTGQVKAALFPSQSSSGRIEFLSMILMVTAAPSTGFGSAAPLRSLRSRPIGQVRKIDHYTLV